jgi:hypothetical protein
MEFFTSGSDMDLSLSLGHTGDAFPRKKKFKFSRSQKFKYIHHVNSPNDEKGAQGHFTAYAFGFFIREIERKYT